MNDCVDIGIIYYEYLIDIENANQQIYEECAIEKIISLENKSPIKEGKIINSILEFIKTIFYKLSEFIKKVISLFSKMQRTELKVNNKLIKNCEEKAKSMSYEDQKAFKIEKVLYSDSMRKFVKFLNEKSAVVGKNLKDVMDMLNAYITNTTFSESSLNNILNDIKKIDDEYDLLSNINNIKKDLGDVVFKDIGVILSEYKNSEASFNLVKKPLDDTQKNAENCKKKIDDIIKKNNEESDNDSLQKFKEVIYKSSDLVIKICKGIISTSREIFLNYQYILNAFVNWSPNVNEESFYFDDSYIV